MRSISDPAAVPDQATFSLDGFFTRLHNAGFQLRPDHYPTVLQVMATFSPRTSDEMAELIAPLIVTNEEEQQRFYALFAEELRTGVMVVVEPPTHNQRTNLSRLPFVRVWQLAALASMLILGFVFFQYYKPDVKVTDKPKFGSPIDLNSAPHVVITSSTGSIKQTTEPIPYFTWGPRLAGILLAIYATWLFERARRQMKLTIKVEADALTNRFRSDRPPHTLPWPNRESELVLPGRTFDEFVSTLRQFSEDEVRTLNVSRSLAATVRSGGLPELIFSHRLREEDFLFLIDTSRMNSQQLHLFEFLFRALSRESVSIERFYYQVPFGKFHNERFPDGLGLGELANRYQTSTLVIWGDGYPLLFDDYPILNPAFVNSLRRWEHRAIMTPVPFPDWGERENALQAEFLVLPADVAGQLKLMQALRENQPDQTAYLTAQTDLYSIADIDFRDVNDLEEYLGEDLFQWLCAMAVYGKVRWEILIEMGKAIMPNPADVSISNLLKLVRISWLREGNFPDVIRLALLTKLYRTNEFKARQTLLDLLYYSDVLYPEGYFFDEERYMLRTINQFVLYRHNPIQYASYKPAAMEFELLWRGNKLSDGTMQVFLNNSSKSWDNLLGEGQERVRLQDWFAPVIPPAERRKTDTLAGIGVLLIAFASFVDVQKPSFAMLKSPGTYTFMFSPNACMGLDSLYKSKVSLLLPGTDEEIPLTFSQFDDSGFGFNDNDTSTAEVSVSAEQISIGRPMIKVATSTYTDSVGFPITEQLHMFEIRGRDCAPQESVKVNIYNLSNKSASLDSLLSIVKTKKLGMNVHFTIKSDSISLNENINIIRYHDRSLIPFITQLNQFIFGARSSKTTYIFKENVGDRKTIDIILPSPNHK